MLPKKILFCMLNTWNKHVTHRWKLIEFWHRYIYNGAAFRHKIQSALSYQESWYFEISDLVWNQLQLFTRNAPDSGCERWTSKLTLRDDFQGCVTQSYKLYRWHLLMHWLLNFLQIDRSLKLYKLIMKWICLSEDFFIKCV